MCGFGSKDPKSLTRVSEYRYGRCRSQRLRKWSMSRGLRLQPKEGRGLRRSLPALDDTVHIGIHGMKTDGIKTACALKVQGSSIVLRIPTERSCQGMTRPCGVLSDEKPEWWALLFRPNLISAPALDCSRSRHGLTIVAFLVSILVRLPRYITMHSQSVCSICACKCRSSANACLARTRNPVV